ARDVIAQFLALVRVGGREIQLREDGPQPWALDANKASRSKEHCKLHWRDASGQVRKEFRSRANIKVKIETTRLIFYAVFRQDPRLVPDGTAPLEAAWMVMSRCIPLSLNDGR